MKAKRTPKRYVAIYLRVSSKTQSTRSQEPDLSSYADCQDAQVKWFKDVFTGKTMDRPGWKKLEEEIRLGKVSQVVVWRIDRLGRTAKELTALFDELIERRVNLVSLKDNLDLSTPAGRLMANLLASVAQYDNEIRAERVLAGQAVARKAGKKWGGSKPGERLKVTKEHLRMIQRLLDDGTPIARIAVCLALSRPTIYRAIRRLKAK